MHALLSVLALLPLGEEKPGAKLVENPEATKLFAEARAARATWEHFPGFTADVELNLDGKVLKGKVEVDAKGKTTVHLSDAEAAAWARRTLGSIVSHRLGGPSESNPPCAFADDDVHHPLGRAIRVLNDEFHSSYRVRDHQIVVVNRTMKDVRFTITVMESIPTAEKKFLSGHFVVNSWDLKSNRLVRSESHQQTYQRVGHYDLPKTVLVVTAGDGKQEAKRLTISHPQLSSSAQR